MPASRPDMGRAGEEWRHDASRLLAGVTSRGSQAIRSSLPLRSMVSTPGASSVRVMTTTLAWAPSKVRAHRAEQLDLCGEVLRGALREVPDHRDADVGPDTPESGSEIVARPHAARAAGTGRRR